MTSIPTADADSLKPVRRIRLPFLESSSLQDVQLLILLLPLWWILGVEQFVWLAGLGYAAIKLIGLSHGRILMLRPSRWYALYLTVILISSLFIVESFRWVTFARNLSAYASGFLAFLIITNQTRTWKQVDRTMKAVVISVLLAGLIGLVGIFGLWQTPVESLFGQVLPEAIASTSYGQRIVARSIGQPDWFSGIGYYFRLTSFYLFATHYATVLIYAIPFLFFYLHLARGPVRIMIVLGIILLGVNLLFTTGRVAMVSLLAGAGYFTLFHSRQSRSIRIMTFIFTCLAILVLLATILVEISVPRGLPFVTSIVGSIQDFVFARGEGSFISRFAVYNSSIEGFLERPLFGWGTERDVPGLRFPAGSHSEYFAVLYRQGLFGVITFAGLLWSTWRHSRPLKRITAATEPTNSFLRYGRWFFVTALVNSIAADPVIDTTVYLVLWCSFGLLVAARRSMLDIGSVVPEGTKAQRHDCPRQPA